MKHIGLVGGLSPGSTIEYYRIICSGFNEIYGGWNFPQITIRSLNLQEIADLFNNNQWNDVADKIVSAIYDLQRAGADFAAIATNTPHNAYERIKEYSPLEVLSIMDATAEVIKKDDITKVGLLGTRQTMEYGFFQRIFDNYGFKTFIPDDGERKRIDEVIWKELVHGKITGSAKRDYIKIMQNLANKGAEGIILGCTEIPLLIKPKDIAVKTYDTTTIHAKAILEYALK